MQDLTQKTSIEQGCSTQILMPAVLKGSQAAIDVKNEKVKNEN